MIICENFAIEGTDPKDIDLFLGPFSPGERMDIVPANWTMAHIMHAAGCFSSINEAKRNGWNKPIPDGYSDYTVGKRRINICVLGKMLPWEEDNAE